MILESKIKCYKITHCQHIQQLSRLSSNFRLFLSLDDPLSIDQNVFFSYPPPSTVYSQHTEVKNISFHQKFQQESLTVTSITRSNKCASKDGKKKKTERRTCSLVEITQCYAQVFDLIKVRNRVEISHKFVIISFIVRTHIFFGYSDVD